MVELGQPRTDVSRCWPTLVDVDQIWAKRGATLANMRQTLAKPGQHQVSFSEYRPTLVRVWPTTTKLRRFPPAATWIVLERRPGSNAQAHSQLASSSRCGGAPPGKCASGLCSCPPAARSEGIFRMCCGATGRGSKLNKVRPPPTNEILAAEHEPTI